jgi:hypothetical protein
MRKRLDHMHLACARDLQHLQNQEAYRTGAEQRHGLKQAGLGEIDCMDRDAERLKHRGLERIHPRRQRHDLRFRNPDLPRHRAVKWRRADEFDVWA